MHNKLPSFFSFIDILNKDHIRKLNKKIAIIYRNYSIPYDKKLILDIKKICKKDGRKFFLSNNLKLAINLDLDGVYLPSFNKNQNIQKKSVKNNFLIMGSAHSIDEIIIKEKQGAKLIFISPLFKTNKKKNFLNPLKFNLLASKTKRKVIALGGISSKNMKKLKLTKAFGFGAISYFEKNDKVNL